MSQIFLNDNKIPKIPLEMGCMSSLKIVHLHKNPIVDVPIQIYKFWPTIEEFSLDWFSYLIPFVGRIIKKVPDKFKSIAVPQSKISSAK
jgi:hypothetical protein